MDGAPVNSFRKQDGRFMPGTSGNPNGRPRGSLNRRTLAMLEGIQGARGDGAARTVGEPFCGGIGVRKSPSVAAG
jgi:hypothetical protein